jgi:hypothetical protein
MAVTRLPGKVHIRMYQVGFGDCFLVTLDYGANGNRRKQRHILFDFGSTAGPRNGRADLAEIAALIEEHTNGALDVLVVTHRHRDHLQGFGTSASAEVMRRLTPKLVLRSWTEDPALLEDATGPADGAGLAARRFVAQLAEAQSAVERIAAGPAGRTGALHDLRAAAAAEMPNQEAVTTLDELAADGKGRYLHAGMPCKLGNVVPGLKITVLGPPTVEQHPRVAHQVSSDPEYWMLRLQRSLAAASADPITPAAPSDSAQPDDSIPPGPVRWLVERLGKHRTHSTARLVRALDDAMNNTSLILLLEIGKLKMLFTGDAQIENWEFTLDRFADDPGLKAKLASVDLYKVGHHGSRNATPRSLHALWTTDRPAGTPPLTALMSTRPDFHGKAEKTKVPRATLVTALQEVATLHSTDDFPPGQLFLELTADTSGGPFRPV